MSALYRKDATGAAPDQRLAPWPGPALGYPLTDWSRNGRFVLNTRGTVETQSDIWVIPVTPDGHLAADVQPKPYLRTPVNESAGRFSPEPNPRWIAYQSDESGHDEVYIQSFPTPGTRYQVTTGGAVAHYWSPDGKRIICLTSDLRAAIAFDIQTEPEFHIGPPREFARLPGVEQGDFSRDLKHDFALLPVGGEHPRITMIQNWTAALRER